jgi:hypothetical protein
MDTGSAVDLVSARDGPSDYVHGVLPLDVPISLSTANGRMLATKCVEMQVGTLADVVSPLVLNSTPPVLSVGKRCMDEGYI